MVAIRRSLSQSSSRRLIWSRPVSVAFTAAFQSSQERGGRRIAADRDEPAVELRERRRQRLAPEGMVQGRVAVPVMHQRHVEPVEHLEDVAHVGQHDHVRVHVERALEARPQEPVDLGAEPGVLEHVDPVEDRDRAGRVGEEVDREPRAVLLHRGRGAGGELEILLRPGGDEDHAASIRHVGRASWPSPRRGAGCIGGWAARGRHPRDPTRDPRIRPRPWRARGTSGWCSAARHRIPHRPPGPARA